MKISSVKIENFRSIRTLNLALADTTVFLGPNDAGKTAILDAVRIVLSRRWGQRGTGFTENDVHKTGQNTDPRTLPPVSITLTFEEPEVGTWDADMVASLDDVTALTVDGRNIIQVRVTCNWNAETDVFEPSWTFLNEAGEPTSDKRRAANLTRFFEYVPTFWLGPVRDAASEFNPRSSIWGRLLKSVKIPETLKTDVLTTLGNLDARILASDPLLGEIAAKIGNATKIAITDRPGSARINTLPMDIEDLLLRMGIVMRNQDGRPWLPLSHHGHGLQSLAVIFLFQASVIQQLAQDQRPGTEAIFVIEEPETHLHPQAARTLWENISAIAGQKLMATHSPFFVQNIPLRDLRVVRLVDGESTVAYIPAQIPSTLPWNERVGVLANTAQDTFKRDSRTGMLATAAWFDQTVLDRLKRCYRDDPEYAARRQEVDRLRYESRILPSVEDEIDLAFNCRRIRGEMFFSRRWILVEGVTEYLLLHALGKALDWSLDANGVTVIDFQLAGSAGIYPTLGDAFGIPWNMIVDGDAQGTEFRNQLLKRGFTEANIQTRFVSLSNPNTIEMQLVVDGHEALLRQILVEVSPGFDLNCPSNEFFARLEKNKTSFMANLAKRVAEDRDLASRMPQAFVSLITSLRDGAGA